MISTNNDKFGAERAAEVGPHALLGEMVSRLTPLEAQLLVTTAASTYPSTVAQSILRDVLSRCRIKHEEAKA